MKSFNTVVANLSNEARVPTLRAITHSAMARTIGAIRQDMRNRSRLVRNTENEYASTDLEQRNELDENSRAAGEIEKLMGFEVTDEPIVLANKLHRVYDYAEQELKTIAVTKWDYPLSFEQMLDFMITKAQTLDKELVKVLAQAAGTDEKTILTMHELQDKQERAALLEAAPEITSTFQGLEDGDEDALDALAPFVQYQLATKSVAALEKAKNQLLSRVIKTRRIADLGAVPLIDEGVKQINEWISEFEDRHSDEFREMIEAGRF